MNSTIPVSFFAPEANNPGLPDDLQAVSGAAIHLVTIADQVRRFCSDPILTSRDEGTTAIANAVANLVRMSRERQPAVFAAITAAKAELQGVRTAPVRFGSIEKACAHEAALAYASIVTDTVKSAADPEGWRRCCPDNSARMDLACIERNFAAVQERFQSLELPSASSIIAEVNSEAARVACVRKASNPPGANDIWKSATEAVEILNDRGLHVTLSWMSRNKNKFRYREPHLRGRHQWEVEIGSLAGALVKRGRSDQDEPDQAEQAKIEDRKAKLKEQKRMQQK